MRLQPIERPTSLVMRVAYWITKRRLGKVITPMKVIYARVPKSLSLARAMSAFSSNADLLGTTTRELVLARIAQLNACVFCADISRMRNLDDSGLLEKLAHIEDYEASAIFSETERAALAFADELTKTRRVSDSVFERARRVLRDEQLAELALLCAVENYYNMVNHAFEIPSDDLCALRKPRAARRASNPAV